MVAAKFAPALQQGAVELRINEKRKCQALLRTLMIAGRRKYASANRATVPGKQDSITADGKCTARKRTRPRRPWGQDTSVRLSYG